MITIMKTIVAILLSTMLIGCEIVAGSSCAVSLLFSSTKDKIENINLPDAKVGEFYQVRLPYSFYYADTEQNQAGTKIINGLTVVIDYGDEANYLIVSGVPIAEGKFELAHAIDIIHPSMCSPGKDKHYYYRLNVIN